MILLSFFWVWWRKKTKIHHNFNGKMIFFLSFIHLVSADKDVVYQCNLCLVSEFIHLNKVWQNNEFVILPHRSQQKQQQPSHLINPNFKSWHLDNESINLICGCPHLFTSFSLLNFSPPWVPYEIETVEGRPLIWKREIHMYMMFQENNA